MVRNFIKSPIVQGAVMVLGSASAHANFSGTDVNLGINPAAGGMAGAAYTRPEEPSAAVFGNPATLTQFKGFNMNFGASLLMIDATNKQSLTVPGVGSFENRSTSDADNYLIPTFGMTLEMAPGVVLGIGLEADGGLGADYRDDPIMLTAGAATDPALGFSTPITLPVVVELISFNANLALGYEVTEKLSVGIAGTAGFGLVQFGTAGTTTGVTEFGVKTFNPGLTDFGGTTSSVHDIGFAASIGATYALNEQVMLSAALKSEMEYNFRTGVHSTVVGGDGWQKLTIDTPMEVIVGIALDDLLLPGLAVEADVIWKEWSKAAGLQDVWDDQFSLALGGRYTTGNWIFRAGYKWSEPQQLSANHAGNTVGALLGAGSLPLGATADAAGFGAVAGDIIGIVQTTLTPVIMEHTLSIGAGYNFTETIRVDGYISHAMKGTEKRYTPNLNALGGLPATEFEASTSTTWVGLGINVAMP